MSYSTFATGPGVSSEKRMAVSYSVPLSTRVSAAVGLPTSNLQDLGESSTNPCGCNGTSNGTGTTSLSSYSLGYGNGNGNGNGYSTRTYSAGLYSTNPSNINPCDMYPASQCVTGRDSRGTYRRCSNNNRSYTICYD